MFDTNVGRQGNSMFLCRSLIFSCTYDTVDAIYRLYLLYPAICFMYIHSPSKCLAWVKKWCHAWLDQNFDPSLLTNKLWLVFVGMKQKKKFYEKKIQNGRLKKTEFFNFAKSWAISAKISWIGPWVSRIDWCEGHQCDSTYMAVRLSDVSSKKG